MTNEELLLIKAELESDPLNLGLTTVVDDDQANAEKLMQTRPEILMYRAAVNANELNIPIDEYAAASQSQRDWYAMQTADGSIDPAVIEVEFYKMFGPSTAARASFDARAKESTYRARQLFGRHINITASDVANARNLTV
jgi:hypothetical protein